MIRYMPIERRHLEGVIRLCEVEGWESYTKDLEATWRALIAPGVTTIVAIDDKEVIGFVQMQSDEVVQAHLSLVVVARDRRRDGIGRQLVTEAFKRCGGKRVDLICTEDIVDFYRSFTHQQWNGFRIYPHLKKEEHPSS